MGKINVAYVIKSKIKIRKKDNTEIKEIIHKSPSKRSFTNGIHSLLKRAYSRERESADIIYLICDAYR